MLIESARERLGPFLRAPCLAAASAAVAAAAFCNAASRSCSARCIASVVRLAAACAASARASSLACSVRHCSATARVRRATLSQCCTVGGGSSGAAAGTTSAGIVPLKLLTAGLVGLPRMHSWRHLTSQISSFDSAHRGIVWCAVGRDGGGVRPSRVHGVQPNPRFAVLPFFFSAPGRTSLGPLRSAISLRSRRAVHEDRTYFFADRRCRADRSKDGRCMARVREENAGASTCCCRCLRNVEPLRGQLFAIEHRLCASCIPHCPLYSH